MPISDIARRNVVTIGKSEPLAAAARLMREHHVGSVVIVDETDGGQVPVGIVTDRDLVIEILAKEVDLDSVLIGDIMDIDLLTTTDDFGIYETIQLMNEKGVRRIPIVNRAGHLVGIVTVDDVLEFLSEELSTLARTINREQIRERQTRP